MTQRYFIEPPPKGPRAHLLGDEARHLVRVMRARPGDEVTLFDGQGCEYRARVETLGRAEVVLEILSRAEVSRETTRAITFGVALPKGERQRWLVEKLVELGARGLVPLLASHGVAQPGDQALKRLRRAVIEASKQCGRNRLLQVAEPMGVADYISSAPPAAARWLADPEGRRLTLGELSAPQGNDANNEFFLAIGPEGGFSPEERRLATSHGWRVVGLGPRILRVETAAVALAAWLTTAGDD